MSEVITDNISCLEIPVDMTSLWFDIIIVSFISYSMYINTDYRVKDENNYSEMYNNMKHTIRKKPTIYKLIIKLNIVIMLNIFFLHCSINLQTCSNI